MDYEKVNKVLMMIFEKKYNVKINAKVKLKEGETNEKQNIRINRTSSSI